MEFSSFHFKWLNMTNIQYMSQNKEFGHLSVIHSTLKLYTLRICSISDYMQPIHIEMCTNV